MRCAAGAVSVSHPVKFVSTHAQFQLHPGGDTKSLRGHVAVALLPHMSVAPSSPYQKSDNTSNWAEQSSQLPKLEPFSRSRISRFMREPTLLEKTRQALAERCMALEGEDAYRCWEALFEFENIKEDCEVRCHTASPEDRMIACRPLERLEHMVRQSNSLSSLMENVKMLARMHKASVDHMDATSEKSPESTPKESGSDEKSESGGRMQFPEPGGLPPTKEELELEESAMMPDSSYTRMLRRRGRPASWYTHRPEHETD